MKLIATDRVQHTGHGLIFGGYVERLDSSDSRVQAFNKKGPTRSWPSVKRAPGAHRIATHLRDEGWDVEVIDFIPAWSFDQFKQLIKSRVSRKTKFIGISQLFNLDDLTYTNKINDMLSWFKKTYPWIATIAGSMNLSATMNLTNIDYYVTGFGEVGIVELLKKLTGHSNDVVITEFKLKNKTYKLVECQKYHPAFPKKDLQVDYEDRDFIQSDEILTVELARGCRFKCKFCSFSVLGVKGDYTRCVDGFKQELLNNYNKYGVTSYTVSDETINDHTEKLIKYGDAVQEMPFEVNLAGFCRADLAAIKREDWEHMARMGLWSQFYGIESFNHKAAKAIGKGYDPEKIKQGLVDIHDYFNKTVNKYRATYSFIIGLPHETPETFMDGFNWTINQFPNQSYNFYPLVITRAGDSPYVTNPSEFEATWKDSGVFREASAEELGIDWSEVSSVESALRHYIDKPFFVNWAHDSMNIWDAVKVFHKVASTIDTDALSPHIFYYHRFLTNNSNMNMNDMLKSFKEIEPFSDNYLTKHMEFINNYIEKKLAL